MSLNPHVATRLEDIRAVLVAQGHAARSLSSASKGREREIFVNEFLSKVFPSHFRFGTGDITDVEGRKSGQVDIVVELPFFPSYPVPGGAPRLYMAEGVASAIEVKSNLRTEWADVERTTVAIKALVPRRIRTMWMGMDFPDTTPVVAIGYAGYKTLEGLVDRMLNTSEERRPDVALVLEDPGLLVAHRYEKDEEGNDMYLATDGPEALFAFLARLNWYLTKLITAGFSMDAYAPHSDLTS